MYIYTVEDIIEYESSTVVAVFSTEELAREYARTAELFTDARSIYRAELDNPDADVQQIAFQWRDQKGEF